MIYPPKPTCHANAKRIRIGEITWFEPRVDIEYGISEPFRRCSFCGGIHPEDLLRLLGEGAELQGADWKYGWPHKFYVAGIPNRTTEVVARIGSTFKGSMAIPMLGKPPVECHVKWYNDHITDDGYDDEARAALLSALASSGITFKMEGEKLLFSAPRLGFQK